MMAAPAVPDTSFYALCRAGETANLAGALVGGETSAPAEEWLLILSDRHLNLLAAPDTASYATGNGLCRDRK